MNQEETRKANKLYDEGSISELYKFIKPFLEKKDPYAYYFHARFSMTEWDESEEEYDKRYMDLINRAAKADVPEAMYQLASLYFVGDGVELNIETGKHYLDRAMTLGYGHAKLSIGVNFYYGLNGYAKDIEKSIELISEAVSEGVEGASDALEKIKFNESE